MVRRIKDDLIDTLVFRNKYEIVISDIFILPVCFLKVKQKVNKIIKRNKAPFHCLFAFRWIPNTKTWNTQFKIWNTQLSQKEVGKYPIASNPYLELWSLPAKMGKIHCMHKLVGLKLFGVGLPLFPVELLLFARWESWTPVFKILVRALPLIPFWDIYPQAFLKKQRGYCNGLRPSVCPSVCPLCYLLLNHWTKFNQIWCVSYSHEWGGQWQFVLAPPPWALGKGQKVKY